MSDKTVVLKVETAGTAQSSKDLRKVAGDLKSMGAAGVNAAGNLSKGLLAAGAAVGLLMDDIVGSVDEMNTYAAATGLSVDTIKGLSIEARRTGKDLQDLVPKDLAKKMLEAQQGSKGAQENFASLGITMGELDTLTPDEALGRVIDGLQAIESDGKRAAVASQLLGENGAQMLSAFADGSDGLEKVVGLGREFGIDVGPEAQKQAKAWQDATLKLGLAFDEAKAKVQPFVGTTAGLVSDFALGATFAFSTLGAAVDTIGTRLGLLMDLDMSGFLADVQERGFGVSHALNAGVKAAYEFETAMDDLEAGVTDGVLYGPELPPEKGVAGTIKNIGVAIDETSPKLDEFLSKLVEQHEARERMAAEVREQENADAVAEFDRQTQALIQHKAFIAAKEQAEMDARHTAQDQNVATYNAIAGLAETTTGVIIDQLDTTSKKGRETAMALFVAQKAVALSQVVVSTSVAIMQAFAQLGPIAGIGPAIAMGANGLAQGVIIGAQKPSFHIGHRAADEQSVTIRSRERVMTPLGMETAASNGAVADLNAGVSSAPRSFALQVGHRALGEVVVEQLRDTGSALAQAVTSTRSRKLGRAY